LNKNTNYLCKIAQSRLWVSIERANKISSSKWLEKKQLSEELRVKFDDGLEKMNRSEEEKLEEFELFYSSVNQTECDLSKSVLVEAICGKSQPISLHSSGLLKFEGLRILQSAIEKIEQRKKLQMDTVAYEIAEMCEEKIDEIPIAKRCEFLYPYLQMKINAPQLIPKHRIICLVLSSIVKYYKNYFKRVIPMKKEMLEYLIRALTETNDEWTQLYSLVAVDQCGSDGPQKGQSCMGVTSAMPSTTTNSPSHTTATINACGTKIKLTKFP